MDFKNKIEIQISSYIRENKNLKETYKKLEESYLNLQNKYSDLKTRYSLISSKETHFSNLEKNILDKDKEILDLKEKINMLESNFEKYKNEYDIRYEYDVNQVKYFNQNNQNKIENINKLEQLNKILYNKILSLEEIIQNFKTEEKKKLNEMEIEYEKKLNEIKRTMLKFLKKGEIFSKSSSNLQNNLSLKLNNLLNKELLNELEYQSYQIEDLLKQRDNLDKIINSYKNDIDIHKNVEKILSEKNQKYTGMIKVLSDKIESINNSRLSSSKNCEKESNNNLKHFKSHSLSNNESNNFSINEIINHPNKKSNTKLKMENTIVLTKEYINKNKQLESLKMKYDTLKSKLDYIHSKYSNILDLFDIALDKVYEDENFKGLKNIFVNVDDFKKCDFELLNIEQKYSIIVLIIKYILPFISNEGLSSKLTKTIPHIQTQMYQGQVSLETTISPNNTKNTINPKTFIKKRIGSLKHYNKKGFKKINFSYLSQTPSYYLNNDNSKINLKKSYSVLKF